MHWVVFTDHHGGEVTVGDSLKRGLHRENLAELAAGPLLSTITLSPGTPRPGSPYHRAHFSGLLQMLVTTWQTSPLMVTLLVLVTVFLAWRVVRRLINRLRRGSGRPPTQSARTA